MVQQQAKVCYINRFFPEVAQGLIFDAVYRLRFFTKLNSGGTGVSTNHISDFQEKVLYEIIAFWKKVPLMELIGLFKFQVKDIVK